MSKNDWCVEAVNFGPDGRPCGTVVCLHVRDEAMAQEVYRICCALLGNLECEPALVYVLHGDDISLRSAVV